jgi:TPR repeat protein
VNAVIEALPRKVETPRLPDLDQVALTDTSAASDQQLSSATGQEFVAVDPEPLEARAAPAVEDLLDHGDRLLELGDIAAARLFYGMAAERGSAEGALLMGVTFDPVYFERHGIRGTRPGVSEAVNWYQKAAVLGSRAAEERKNALASRVRLAAHDGDEDARHALKLFFEPASR